MAITRLGTYSQIKGSPWKLPCLAATTADHGLSGTSAVDGVTIAAGDRILVWKQTDGTENGIYIAASGSWTRAIDMSLDDDIFIGTQVYVREGDTYAETVFAITEITATTTTTTTTP